jgi:hypothetical protein
MLWAPVVADVTGTVLSRTLVAKRISGGGEPDSERPDQGSAAPSRRRKGDAGREAPDGYIGTCIWQIDTWADFAGNRAAKVRCISHSERTWGHYGTASIETPMCVNPGIITIVGVFYPA